MTIENEGKVEDRFVVPEIWEIDGKLYRVRAAPHRIIGKVETRQLHLDYIGDVGERH